MKKILVLLVMLLLVGTPALAWTEKPEGILLTPEEVVKIAHRMQQLEQENKILKQQVETLQAYIKNLEAAFEAYKKQFTEYKLVCENEKTAYAKLLEEARQEFKNYAKYAQREVSRAQTRGLLFGLMLGALTVALID